MQVVSALQAWPAAAAAYKACAEHERDPEQRARAQFGAGVALAKLKVCSAAGSKMLVAPQLRHVFAFSAGSSVRCCTGHCNVSTVWRIVD